MEGLAKRERVLDATILVPVQIMKMIPNYVTKLHKAADAQHANEPVKIYDHVRRSTEELHALADVIQLLSGVTVPKISTTALHDERYFGHLIRIYDQSIKIGAKSTENAILAHIENCKDMSAEVLVSFAKTVYNDNKKFFGLPKLETSSSIGRMVRCKLLTHLPSMAQDGTVHKIASEGGTLSNELLRAMIEHTEEKQSIKTESRDQSVN